MEVIVEYNYTAEEPDELTIKKGDIIHDVVKKPGGWWEGVLRDKKGVFPDNFVRQVDSGVIYRSKRDANRIRQCRVVFSYKQDHEDELSLNVGDVINILGEEEEGWWRGVLNGREGVFPSNFVEEIAPSQPVSKASSKENLGPIGWTLESTDTPLVPPKPAKTICQVRFSYKAENEDELTLNEGDLVTLISKEGQDSGWWKGELKGKVGVFPDNFVVVLTSEELIHLQKREEFANQQKKEEPHKSDSTPTKASEEDQKSVNSVTLREDKVDIEPAARITPPVPGKKPSISLKKSPSGSGSTGLFSGLRKKIADVVDGATSSKATPALKHSENKEQPKSSPPDESAFDQVARTPMLQDVRATRAKAPGRRPPSVVMKDGEHGITNGFGSEHSAPLDPLTEPQTSPELSDDPRRLRDQFKVPWLEEMKLNQAKRSSTSPKQEQNKFKSSSPEAEEKTDKPEKEEIAKPSVEPSKPVIKPKLRSSEYENVVTRRLAPQPGGILPPTRPQTISTVTETKLTKLTPSPVLNKISPPPKPQSADRTEAKINKLISNDQGRHSNEINVSDEHGRVSHDLEKNSSDHNKVGHDLSKISSEHGRFIHDSAKVSSEHGRVGHDSAKISSEHGRFIHDSVKISSDHGRVGHDSAKISSEHGRVIHDSPKILSEHGRVGHDSVKISSEHGRVIHDFAKISPEHGRVGHDPAKISLDHGRVNHDAPKISSDHGRVDHDHGRVGHDHSRVGHDHSRVGLDHGRVGHDHGRVLSNDHGENIKGSGDHSRNFDPYYAELLERIKKLEKQNADHEVAIEELKAKLQLETDMRIMLQAELEKVSECVLHA